MFKAVDLWVTKECERQGLCAEGSVKRKILGEKIVKAIRFPVMQSKDFATVVLGSKILTQEEVIDIMKYLNSVESSPVGFPEKQRVGTILPCVRFGIVINDEVRVWYYNIDEKECIGVRVDKDIKLYGIRMFGCKNGDYVVFLKITDSRDSEIVVSKSGKFSSVRFQFQSKFYYGYDVLFDSPTVLRKGFKYCAAAIIDGPPSCYGREGTCDVNSNGVEFSFSDCFDTFENSGDTDFEWGQFAAFLFRPE